MNEPVEIKSARIAGKNTVIVAVVSGVFGIIAALLGSGIIGQGSSECPISRDALTTFNRILSDMATLNERRHNETIQFMNTLSRLQNQMAGAEAIRDLDLAQKAIQDFHEILGKDAKLTEEFATLVERLPSINDDRMPKR